ncbi:metallophosphoesterase [Sphingobacterium psychroaquaticum]|uniref:metallophosphoesterase family protein n=1 Tax=Sphingobacterium psychroaquaticum TaxID=561061 RepID=UPI00106BAA55|nr:metallophosphoesterase family protein [Sphingobacterium psychroaquaticum]QBQ40958.1 metallophosphoesterase [Sphingobacterium psychroaquaticum]
MIQLAIISDIHGNLLALEAVLKDISDRSIDQIYCLGDLVDFAPWGNEVIDRIRAHRIPCLLGNHDERIAYDLPIIPLAHHDAIETANREIAINWSKQSIRADNKQWLAALPYNITLTYKSGSSIKNILLVHATLESNDAYMYRDDSKNELIAVLKERSVDTLVMGHTHQSYIQEQSDILFVNSGSVGRSREDDRKATYTILQITETGIDAEIVKLNYAIDEVASAIYKSDIPNFYGDFLLKKAALV